MIRRPKSIEFHKPVVVQPGRIDRDRVVTSTKEAAAMLLREWPTTGEKRTIAMQACLDAIQGKRSPRTARKAFIDAAKEARIYLGESL